MDRREIFPEEWVEYFEGKGFEVREFTPEFVVNYCYESLMLGSYCLFKSVEVKPGLVVSIYLSKDEFYIEKKGINGDYIGSQLKMFFEPFASLKQVETELKVMLEVPDLSQIYYPIEFGVFC